MSVYLFALLIFAAALLLLPVAIRWAERAEVQRDNRAALIFYGLSVCLLLVIVLGATYLISTVQILAALLHH